MFMCLPFIEYMDICFQMNNVNRNKVIIKNIGII